MSTAHDRVLNLPPAGSGYFFLSFAHSAPPPNRAEDQDPDPPVARFFADLERAVTAGSRRLAPSAEAGFYDQMLLPGADLKAELSRVLGRCEVFVPLYSPKYFETSWALRELEAFQSRIKDAGQPGDGHILPVLWTPFQSWRQPAVVKQAIEQGPSLAAYRERGLRALQWLSAYRSSYEEVVRVLAERIVDVAENYPLGPSKAPDIDAVRTEHPLGPTFTVTFLTSPDGRTQGRDWWHPSDGSAVPPVAERAGEIAERLGLSTRITDLRALPNAQATTPTIALVDPWTMIESESPFLQQAFALLPSWTITVLVNAEDPASPAVMDEAVRALPQSAAGPVRTVRDLSELAGVLPTLITRARRAYLRTTEVYIKAEAPNRRPPRLGDPRRWQSEEHRDD